jgi:protein-S-isoprenylcysteine O-methyltransferase Ste14
MMILFSYLSSKYPLYKRQSVRIIYIFTGVIFVAGGVILLPIIEQPRFDYSIYRVLCGGIVAFIGIIIRIITTLLYLKKQGANPNLDNPNSLVTTGPYGIVRHPQYSSGIVFLMGWFLAWGGIYSLIIYPYYGFFFQAIIEEKYILINKF